ncbi:MAG TPA: hypothetical protein VGN26_02925 [Armatimonadota bacterium]
MLPTADIEAPLRGYRAVGVTGDLAAYAPLPPPEGRLYVSQE